MCSIGRKRTMGQNREPRNRPTKICPINLWRKYLKIQWRIDCLSNKWYWSNWTTIGKKKKELQLKSHNLHKYNSKCNKDLYVKCKTKKLLGKNIGENFQDPITGKILNFCYEKTLLNGWKDKLRSGTKYLQTTFPTKS